MDIGTPQNANKAMLLVTCQFKIIALPNEIQYLHINREIMYELTNRGIQSKNRSNYKENMQTDILLKKKKKLNIGKQRGMFFLSQSPEHNYHARPAFAIRSARWHAEQMSLTPPKYITNCAHCDRQMQISGYYSILKFSGRLDINQGNGGVDFAGEARQSVSVKNEYQTIVYCLHFCQ